MVMENKNKKAEVRLPFYADGCPGMMFAQTENPLVLQPNDLVLDEFILYGQTITPIELCLKGRFRLIVFILYPFVPKALFNIDPAGITDTCIDLESKTNSLFTRLKKSKTWAAQVKCIEEYMIDLAGQHREMNPAIYKAIQHIIDNKGAIPVKSVRESLHMTERTFERNFASQIGISPKLFSQIIQFQAALGQLTGQQKLQLSDIVFQNGFADQSHFIRSFRKFSGQTPGRFKKGA
jgi:AraC-like DNA-binding protein